MFRKTILLLFIAVAGLAFSAEPPFVINAGKIPNMRDLGGWKGLNGRTVKTGQIFRSAGLNGNPKSKKTVDANGVTNTVKIAAEVRVDDKNRALLVDTLGIRTDIDLRANWECAGMTGSPLGEKVEWVHVPIGGYHLATINEKKGEDPKKSAHHRIFKVIMDPAKRPVDFHCIAGRDRTGTIAMLTLALLGVSETDIVRDFLTTASCAKKDLWESRIRKPMTTLRRRFKSESLAESTALYFEHIGFTRAEIDAFREQMLAPAATTDTDERPAEDGR